MYAGGVNFTSLHFMNAYCIYILLGSFDKKGEKFLFSLFMPLCWWFSKKGERNLEIYICMLNFETLYMHVSFSIGIRAYKFCLCKKGRSILHLCIYVLFGLCIHWISLLFIAMHELRGSFYWALLNSCMYNSMSFVIIKKGRLLAQKPITLVLKLINSCNYSINDLVVFKFQILIKILVDA